MKTMILLIIVVVCAIVFFMKGKKSAEESVDGGVTNQTDPLASKQIDSHEIRAFSTVFYLYHDIDSSLDGQYSFSIENGKLSYNDIEVVITDEELRELDEIIRDHDMLERNGLDKVTAGLAPEYQPCSIHIVYESGETYDYRENNDPDAEWAEAMFELFGNILNKNGYHDLMPSEEAYEIDNFEIVFCYDGKTHYYSPIFDGDIQKIMVNDNCIELDDSMFEDLQTIVETYNLETLDTGAYGNDLDRTGDYYELYIGYKNGRRIEGCGTDMSVINPAIDSLIGLFEK